MFLDNPSLLPQDIYAIRNYAVVYPSMDLASKYPHGFIEGSLDYYAKNLSKRFDCYVTYLKTGEKIVVLENIAGIYVKVITENGLVGWMLACDPRSEEQKALDLDAWF